MLSERMADQAEGLRRLLERASTRVVTVAGARSGLGMTSVVVNMAAALANSGRSVLVLDEHLSPANVANSLALKPRYDLLNAVRGDKSLRDVVLCPMQGVHVLPATRAMQALPKLTGMEREQLLECLAEASRGREVVLVDASTDEGRFVSASLAPDQPLLLVTDATAAAITESYALIKRITLQEGRRRFEIVVNRVRDAAAAKTVFDNVAQVARRHLSVRVEYLGYIPVDEKLKRATQLRRSVVEAFPQAPSSRAFAELGHNLILLPAADDDEAAGLPHVIQRLMQQTYSSNMAHAI
ncbi:MAG: AAA family ATPase [Sideroxydans sp.]|nr:AAA family ATPase [Sideroxydans sp.]